MIVSICVNKLNPNKLEHSLVIFGENYLKKYSNAEHLKKRLSSYKELRNEYEERVFKYKLYNN